MNKLGSLLTDLGNTIKRLEEVLRQPKDEFMRDSAIKRFEICFDMTWKTLKAYLEEKHNVQCFSPQTCFREAYNKELIKEYDDFWLKLAELRNKAVHTYRLEVAEEVYAQLPQALKHFEQLYESLHQS